MEKPYLGAYWSARKETRRECAERLSRFLRSIADDPLFARWYPTSYSRKPPKKPPIEANVEALEQRFREQYTDIPKRPMLELGFSLGVWNGKNEAGASAGLRVTCGAYSKFVNNAVVLSLPVQEPPRDKASLERLHTLLKKAVETWDPDSAVITSHEFNARAGGGPPDANGGWITYRRGRGVIFCASQNRSD